MKRAVFVHGKTKITQEIKAVVPLAEYRLLAETHNAMEALRMIHRALPDLIVMGWNLTGLSGADFLQTLMDQRLCPVIVVLGEEEYNLYNDVIQAGAELLLYPFRAIDVLIAIKGAEYRFDRENQYNAKLNGLEQELKTRRLVYQAVLRIIKECGMDEETAYACLRSQAMTTRKNIRSVAQQVIQGMWLP